MSNIYIGNEGFILAGVLLFILIFVILRNNYKTKKMKEREELLISINNDLTEQRNTKDIKVQVLINYIKVKNVNEDYNLIKDDIIRLASERLSNIDIIESIKAFIQINKVKNISAKDFVSTLSINNNLSQKLIMNIMKIYLDNQIYKSE